MSKVAVMFPGQGAQCVGMGKTFFDLENVAKEIFSKSSEITGLDIEHICFDENDLINETKYTQIALLTTELAMLACLEKYGVQFDAAIGLSLGEYAAVVASGAIKIEDAFRIVLKRGEAMQNAYPQGGAMAVVLGMDPEEVEDACNRSSGIINIANYNCPGQCVISGEIEAVENACKRLRFEGAKRCELLNVSGPFHCSLMKKAVNELSVLLDNISFYEVKKPYVSNVTAEYVTDSNKIESLLLEQIVSPVRFMQGIKRLIQDGVTEFIEIGPGRSLSAIVKRIDSNVKLIHIETKGELDDYLKKQQS